jgi:hypothetical protein
MSESLRQLARVSIAPGSTSWPQKSHGANRGISFRDIATLAFPHKTVRALVDLTGRSESTVKYWLSGKHEPPASAVYAVLGEIIRKLG